MLEIGENNSAETTFAGEAVQSDASQGEIIATETESEESVVENKKLAPKQHNSFEKTNKTTGLAVSGISKTTLHMFIGLATLLVLAGLLTKNFHKRKTSCNNKN